MTDTSTRNAAASRLRAVNRQRNIEEFEARAAALESMPRVIFVELTDNCNLSCPMCRSAGKFDRSRVMSPELFSNVAEQLFPTAEIVDLRGWGESTILRDFPRYVDETLEYGCRIRLVTNLTVPNEALWRKLVRSGASIVVSFDAARPETFALLRGGARLDVVLDNLRILVDEGRASGMGTDNIHLNVVVQRNALEELSEIISLAGELGLRVAINPVVLPEGHPDNLRLHRSRLAEELDRAAQRAQELGVDAQLNAALDPEWSDLSHTDKTCTHPWMYCYVNFRGQVGFCDHLVGEAKARYLLGDLTTTSFAEIWNGQAYQRLRSEHAHGAKAISAMFDECRWCYGNRYVDFDQQTYPPYADHLMELRPVHCAGFTPRPRDPDGPAR
ncbi:radical SAM protein [Plantactinospora sp. B5E13]|uniref:radical SAM protein n=1 Tax=unclassified Plantactinospora TaxID=2631981 RepID=UPI00325D5D2C